MSKTLGRLIREVSDLVQSETGVQLGLNQTSMVQFRLTKRMNDLEIDDPDDYLDYLYDHLDDEVKVLVSLLTTHHTFFFREFGHFEYLMREGLPLIIENLKKEGRKTIRIWSAACSRGQEPYSLALFLNQVLPKLAPDMSFEILGSDVDHQSIEIARNGVYRYDEIKEIPALYVAGNFVRGTGDIAEYVKLKNHIKDKCRFKEINLLELSNDVPAGVFDLIFCRNVFIYFTPEQIASITRQMLQHLAPHGIMVIGMSETLNGLRLPVASAAPSVYQHEAFKKPSAPKISTASVGTPKTSQPSASPAVSASPAPARAIRVLSVDDSPTVLTLLKKILPASEGFEVVATAENGLQAAEALKKHTVDVVTLDIHMPEQDGITYLKNHFKPGHPPVVMISSVSREDSALGVKAFEYGAVDYVEKPSLQNLALRGEEIRMKLRLAVQSASLGQSERLDLVKAFEKKVELKDVEGKIRILVAGLGDKKRVQALLETWGRPEPATFVLFHGSESLAGAVGQTLKHAFGPVEALGDTPPTRPSANHIYVGDFKKQFEKLRSSFGNLKTSILLFGDCSSEMVGLLPSWDGAQLIVEDRASLSKNHGKLKEIASYCIPLTGFKYHSDEFLE